jgi:hypothetical protein
LPAHPNQRKSSRICAQFAVAAMHPFEGEERAHGAANTTLEVM